LQIISQVGQYPNEILNSGEVARVTVDTGNVIPVVQVLKNLKH